MEQVKAAIEAVLGQMAERYAAGDVDGVLELFAGEEPLIVGTGADEVRFGLTQIRTQVERDMAQADSISMRFGDLTVRVAGEAAFAYADAAFAGSVGGEDFSLPVRMTVGLVRAGDDWRIAQFHVSVAYGEQTEGESFPS
jgi:ketosteroid isomerase-like protein